MTTSAEDPNVQITRLFQQLRRRNRIWITVFSIVGVMLASNVVWNSSVSFAYDRCNAYAISSPAEEPPGWCHSAYGPNPIGFVEKWLLEGGTRSPR